MSARLADAGRHDKTFETEPVLSVRRSSCLAYMLGSLSCQCCSQEVCSFGRMVQRCGADNGDGLVTC